jgi:hypothetical protein
MNRRVFISKTLTGAALSTVGASLSACHRTQNRDQSENPRCEPVDSHYYRMFPQLARPPSTPGSTLENRLEELGRLMIEDDQAADGSMSTGYTYLGQFIDHDLTFDITPLALAQPCAESIVNYRSPFLDLDHVYGGGPTVSKFLYRTNASERDKERFLIGPDASKGLEYDLPRNREGVALVGDPRNDENLILAQLHVGFLKFHNRVLDELEKGSGSLIQSAGPAGATLFEQARRLVTWHYQYLVIHDFLSQLLDPKVYEGLEPERTPPTPNAFNSFRIPIEFSAAAFRFGHSMVRDKYPYNKAHREISLNELLARTGAGVGAGGGEIPVLPSDWKINWCKFFWIDQMPRSSRGINTTIANGLHSLEHPTLKLFNARTSDESQRPSATGQISPERVLPVRTLWRSARMGLPSGQDAARAMGLKPINDNDIAPDNAPHTRVLRAYGFDKDTPLWYYILKEAEMGNGERLGPVGSRIVANVIVGAVRADPNSYLSVHPAWKPGLPTASNDEIGKILLFADPELCEV